jgi:steroid delta-isomerase-like uncharacterized protein
MSTEQNKATVRRFHEEVWNKGNAKAVDEFVAANYLLHMPLPDQSIAGLKFFVSMIHQAFPDWHETVEDVIAEGDKVVLRGVIRGTQQGEYMGIPASGKSIVMKAIHIFRLENGKIAEDWGEADSLGMMQQLGVIPMPGR